ncbi:MAG: glutathione S-transferase family protein [Reyranellaceae bacterium]
MSELILHHYDYSSFSEKIRLIFGLKSLSWRSVIIPAVAPKPDLTPLTGGYRRTPVLQIGADVFCDTALIARELERRFPQPTLFPGNQRGLTAALAMWIEEPFFWPMARFVTGRNAEKAGATFHADRAAMRNKPDPGIARIKADADRQLPAMRIQFAWLDDMLADGRRYMLGDAPGLLDFTCYHAVWFLDGFEPNTWPDLRDYRNIVAWMKRVAAIGHGRRREMDAKEALSIARKAVPETPPPSPAIPPECRLEGRISIRATDNSQEAVIGEVVYCDTDEVAIARHDETVGDVIVHFPRMKYSIRQAG